MSGDGVDQGVDAWPVTPADGILAEVVLQGILQLRNLHDHGVKTRCQQSIEQWDDSTDHGRGDLPEVEGELGSTFHFN